MFRQAFCSKEAHVLNQSARVPGVVDRAIQVRGEQPRSRTGHVVGFANRRVAADIVHRLKMPRAAEKILHEALAERSVVLEWPLTYRARSAAVAILILQFGPIPVPPWLARDLLPALEEVRDALVKAGTVVDFLRLAVVREILRGFVWTIRVVAIVSTGQKLEPPVRRGCPPSVVLLMLQGRKVEAETMVAVVGHCRQPRG
mmetsp:Transcript_88960/g.212339  ORF Transcript_88960/g.212339 Transcript_88960/m.212339 type:complete len:201 (+) Transcript_88960:1338-1940(+)